MGDLLCFAPLALTASHRTFQSLCHLVQHNAGTCSIDFTAHQCLSAVPPPPILVSDQCADM